MLRQGSGRSQLIQGSRLTVMEKEQSFCTLICAAIRRESKVREQGVRAGYQARGGQEQQKTADGSSSSSVHRQQSVP